MLTPPRIRFALASSLTCLLFFSPRALPSGEQPLGRILYAQATSLRGVAVPKSETILSGDLIATSDEGSALVEFKSGARLKITANSSVRLVGEGEKVRAELLAGAVVSESTGKPTLEVTTSKFQFAPSQEASSRYAVALSKEQETFAGAMKGNLLVQSPDSTCSYVLPEGEYAAIPASSVDVPAEAIPGGAPTSPGQAGTVMVAGAQQVIQHHGQSGEVPLKVPDNVFLEDVIRTLRLGQVRIALLDGSYLNICAGSVMKILKHDAQAQQTQIELTLGLMRAEGVKLTKLGASFQVQTQTASIGVLDGVLFVHAFPDITQVCSIEGTSWVRNLNPAIVGQVTLQFGHCTTVPRGLPPTPPTLTSVENLPCQIYTAGRVWHIGRLGEGSSLLLLIALAAAATAAVAVPVLTSPTVPF